MKRLSDEEILDELEIELELNLTKVLNSVRRASNSGFEEINVFYETHQRVPCLNDDADIFENYVHLVLTKLNRTLQ